MALKTDDLRIIEMQELSTPAEVRGELPVTESDAKNILSSRKTIEKILDEKDDRIFVVVGPCSIHDPIAAMDYANRLKKISDKVSSNLFIVMRVYFENLELLLVGKVSLTILCLMEVLKLTMELG